MLFQRQNLRNNISSTLFQPHVSVWMSLAIWDHLVPSQNIKNTCGGVLFLVKLQAERLQHYICPSVSSCLTDTVNIYELLSI